MCVLVYKMNSLGNIQIKICDFWENGIYSCLYGYIQPKAISSALELSLNKIKS